MEFFLKEQLLQNIKASKKRDNEEPFNILCCINDSYVNQLIALMTSIRHFCDKKINLYVLSASEFSSKNISFINEKMKFLNITPWAKVIKLPELQFNKGEVWSIDVYLRVFAFDLLPKNVKKILYIDGDALAYNDISELYSINLENKLLAYALEFNVDTHETYERRRRYGITHDYFNSGVLLMNLEQQRKMWRLDKIIAYINQTWFEFPDQDLLNMLTKEEDIVLMPYRNNYQSWWELKDRHDLVVVNPTIIHFCGLIKPWQKNDWLYATQLYCECVELAGLKDFCKDVLPKEKVKKQRKK